MLAGYLPPPGRPAGSWHLPAPRRRDRRSAAVRLLSAADYPRKRSLPGQKGYSYYYESRRQASSPWGKGADVGFAKKAARKRAVGTREHIVAYLAEVHELFDASGMASTRLSAAVGYPGSSVAFAQLLSGMERSGLIKREVRGKRTYRISLGLVQALGVAEADEPPGPDGLAGSDGLAGIGTMGGAGTGGFDYDELARRLLVQVVRRLAAAEPGTGAPEGGRRRASGRRASAWTEHSKLAEENVRLRVQLEAARHSLELAAERLRKLPITADLDRSEIVLLQQLLSPGASGGSGGSGGSGSDADARSLLS